MKSSLHIVINSEAQRSSAPASLYSLLHDMNLNFVQVVDISQFDILIKSLPTDLQVYVWVHPNASEMPRNKRDWNEPNQGGKRNRIVKNNEEIDATKSTPGSMSALALKKKKHIRFRLISRYPNDLPVEYVQYFDKPPVEINDMLKVISETEPQTVGEINGEKPSKKGNGKKAPLSNEAIDFAIIAALHEEYLSIERFVDDLKDVKGEDNLKTGRLRGTTKSVLIGYQSDMGMIDAACLSTKIVLTYCPKYFVMVGVCGGRIKKDVKILDLIIPAKIFDYQTGKYEDHEFKPYLRVGKININSIRSHIKTITRNMEDDVIDSLKDVCKNLVVHTRSLACGNYVVKSKGFMERQIAKQDEEVQGVEMESYGLLRACELYGKNRVHPIVIKSVMDLTDGRKSDLRKKDAAYLSASFAYYLCKQFLS